MLQRHAICLWFALAVTGVQAAPADDGWPTYGGDAGGQRYSTAKQINRDNVSRLHVAWTYHTHALDGGRPGARGASFETTPVLFRGLLYLTTPFDEIVALDPETGERRWSYQPPLANLNEGDLNTSRGVATWDSGGRGVCAARVFVGTDDAQLVAVDAESGVPCVQFGDHGRIDLKTSLQGMARAFHVTSAPTVLGDVVVVGSSIPDNIAVNMAGGMVRAYDARTGRQVWTWEPIPWAASQRIRTGAGNVWSTIAADPTLGLLYLPTGSASPDYYGGLRPGDNRDADSIVAIEAATGRKVWAFQLVHHNLWDYDVASEPLLFTWHGNVPAVAVTTKMGMVFVFDRRTGVPLFPIEERAVPASDVKGEKAWPTQPISSLPPLNPLDMNRQDWTSGRDAENARFCQEQMSALDYKGIYTPPSLRGTLVFPGALGGVNWGSAAYDPESGLLYANTNSLPYFVKLIPHRRLRERMVRHLFSRERTLAILVALMAAGLMMAIAIPRTEARIAGALLLAIAVAGFAFGLAQREAERRADAETAHRLAEIPPNEAKNGAFGEDHSPQEKAPYELFRHPILDHRGFSCAPQPWGRVTALNLQTGKVAWERAHGTQIEGEQTGSPSLGGLMVTAGGLVFSAGTREPLLRAYDAATGEELWHGDLPVPAQATPMTYSVKGRQFVVIAAGGSGLWETKQGDSVVAFALR